MNSIGFLWRIPASWDEFQLISQGKSSKLLRESSLNSWKEIQCFPECSSREFLREIPVISQEDFQCISKKNSSTFLRGYMKIFKWFLSEIPVNFWMEFQWQKSMFFNRNKSELVMAIQVRFKRDFRKFLKGIQENFCKEIKSLKSIKIIPEKHSREFREDSSEFLREFPKNSWDECQRFPETNSSEFLRQILLNSWGGYKLIQERHSSEFLRWIPVNSWEDFQCISEINSSDFVRRTPVNS